MDTLTHGLLGAAAAQAVFGKQLPRSAALIGAVAGMAPDLDVFLISRVDPVSGFLVHRQFTHSLIFIPVGALLVALLFLWMKKFHGVRLAVFGAAFIGYGLHGLLDACTSYGTMLLWPFSNRRIAWDVIAIVDPLFSVVLLIGVLWTLTRRRIRPARVAVCLALLYLGFGLWQQQRAVGVQHQLATARGHVIEYSRVMPLPGHLVPWRSVYVTGGHVQVDGVRVPWWRTALAKEGGAARLATFNDVPSAMAEQPGTRRIFDVFVWFADGLIAPVEGVSHVIGDLRYGADASSPVPLWGIQFDPQRADGPARWRAANSSRWRLVRFIWAPLFDGDAGYRPVFEALKGRQAYLPEAQGGQEERGFVAEDASDS